MMGVHIGGSKRQSDKLGTSTRRVDMSKRLLNGADATRRHALLPRVSKQHVHSGSKRHAETSRRPGGADKSKRPSGADVTRRRPCTLHER